MHAAARVTVVTVAALRDLGHDVAETAASALVSERPVLLGLSHDHGRR